MSSRANMRSPRTRIQRAGWWLTALVVAGCGRTGSLAEVRGTVLYGGSPVAGASVVFAPDPTRGGSGPLAFAETGLDGCFALKTEGQAGVPPGWYRITIMALASPAAQVDTQTIEPPRCRLPDKYRDPEWSGLTCEVKAGLKNEVMLRLD